VLRASAGPLESLVDVAATLRLRKRAGTHASPPTPPPASAGPVTLNWKGRLVQRLRRMVATCLFPDERAAWVWDARRVLRDHLARTPPDVALVMHEPAATLLLARALEPRGIPWLADLADPVLAGYTPRHWRRAAHRLEADTLRAAASVSVTNAATATMLRARHPGWTGPVDVLPQGFDPQPRGPTLDSLPLRLAYTGRFYSFRPPAPLLEALARCEDVVVDVAGPEMPEAVLAAALRMPARLRLHGDLDHAGALALQARADVLLSVGNLGTVQTPGKLHEYFGLPTPILHLWGDPADPIPALLAERQRGLACRNDATAIEAVLRELVSLKRSSKLAELIDPSPGRTSDLAWSTLGGRMAGLLASIASPPAP
jgi:hypothetical protein